MVTKYRKKFPVRSWIASTWQSLVGVPRVQYEKTGQGSHG
jgi:hypothetical protein